MEINWICMSVFVLPCLCFFLSVNKLCRFRFSFRQTFHCFISSANGKLNAHFAVTVRLFIYRTDGYLKPTPVRNANNENIKGNAVI